MAVQEMELDPNAQAYTDDEIVGKVNSATAKVSADSTEDGSTNKVYTNAEQTKLTGIDENASDDQTGDEMVTAIDAGASSITREDAINADSMNVVKTDPAIGEFYVKSIHRKVSGKAGVKYDDVAKS